MFLDPGTGRGVLRDGMFHIEMYMIVWEPGEKPQRKLVSDWQYPTDTIPTIARPGMLGEGYFLHLRWANKSVAGHEIEIITQFEEPGGQVARSGTKRLRVPKYSF